MDERISQKKIYEISPPKLYYDALTKGNAVQRFWHNEKFNAVANKLDLPRKSHIIDVGCGPGVLLKRVKKKGFIAFGMDISKSQVKFSNNLLKNQSNFIGASQSMPLKVESCDCALMVEVIEHLDSSDADMALHSIHEILKEKGNLILTTPNYRSLWPIVEYFWSKINPINYNEQHKNKLNILKLRKTLERSGYKNFEIETIFIISPFVAIISKKIARLILKLEKKVFPNSGCLIILKCTK